MSNNYWFEAKNVSCLKNEYEVVKNLNLRLKNKENITVREISYLCEKELVNYSKQTLVSQKFKNIVKFRFKYRPEFIEKDDVLIFREGKTKGIGKIVDVEYDNLN